MGTTRRIGKTIFRDAARLVALSALSSAVLAHEGEGHAPAQRPQTERFWTALPVIVAGGARAERGTASLAGRNIGSAELLVYNPNAVDKPVPVNLTEGRWLVAPATPDKGGHHWLLARENRGDQIITASTAWTFPAKGDAPTRLLRTSKGGLEIVPDHLPEHGGMREGEDWEFHVRFDGRPLPAALLRLETESGTQSRAIGNADGVVRITFPRDIDPAAIDPKQGATRTRKAFVLAAEYQQAAIKHQTAFNYFYYPDLMRERSVSAGVGFLALGMLLALPLLRRKESANG